MSLVQEIGEEWDLGEHTLAQRPKTLCVEVVGFGSVPWDVSGGGEPRCSRQSM
ncbi:MAG: hypothetical protein P8Y14_16335 [Anaerolineales bacterium]